MSEHCVRRGDTMIAGKSHIHASAHAVAADGSRDRHGKAVNRQRKLLAAAGEREGFRAAEPRDFIQVRAGGKELLIAGDDQGFDAASFGIRAQLLNRREQRPDAGDGKNICAVR